MVSESMKLSFNLLISFLAFGSVTSYFGFKVCGYHVFLEKDKTDLRQIFFRI